MGRPFKAAVETQLPPGFSDEILIDDLANATTFDWAPDGRMFVALQDGRVLIYENGVVLPEPFIDLSAEVNSFGDRGLLGMALDPNFATMPHVYLFYVYDPPGLLGTNEYDQPDGAGARVSRLLRVTADSNNPNQALPGSELVLLGKQSLLEHIVGPDQNSFIFGDYPPPSCMDEGVPIRDCVPADSFSHSVGAVRFAVDGSLFVANGDSSTPHYVDYRALRALNLDIPAGKIFRIDPQTGNGFSDNPFFDGDVTGNRSKVAAYGLRNPFRFILHPVTGELLIADVGGAGWEELNIGQGNNYGWPCYEGIYANYGFSINADTAATCAPLYALPPGSVTFPVVAYPNPGGAAIVAGPVYSGTIFPAEYHGKLFVGDYNAEWIKYIDLDDPESGLHDFLVLDESIFFGPVEIRQGPDGNLYYIAFGLTNSQIRRVRYIAGGNTAPTARLNATPNNGGVPLEVNFSAAASTDPDAQLLTYEWDFGDGEFGAGITAMHTYSPAATYTAILTVTDSLSATSTAQTQIAVGNHRPTAVISTPVTNTLFAIGEMIEFSGGASDVEEGELGGEQLQWILALHHNQHIHPSFLPPTSGATGSFAAPDHGDNTWFELCLTATDLGGLKDTTCRTLAPNASLYTIDTVPAGFSVHYNGVEHVAPFSVAIVKNAEREVSAPTVQGGYTFMGWTGSLEPTYTFTATDAPTVITAAYVNLAPVALVSAAPVSGVISQSVTFTGTGSYDPEGTALNYQWDFGDGQTATTANVTHTYGVGTFLASLTVSDTLGLAATTTVTISVASRIWLPSVGRP